MLAASTSINHILSIEIVILIILKKEVTNLNSCPNSMEWDFWCSKIEKLKDEFYSCNFGK